MRGHGKRRRIGNMGEVITGEPLPRRQNGNSTVATSCSFRRRISLIYGLWRRLKRHLPKQDLRSVVPSRRTVFLFVCIGSTIGKVAQCSRPCATNQQINSLVASPAFVADFVYYLLDRESLRVARLAGKQAVPIINKSLFATVKVTAPTRAEQQRIADCLSSLDAGLTTHLQKLNALKTHKQGLMQQLFPSLERH